MGMSSCSASYIAIAWPAFYLYKWKPEGCETGYTEFVLTKKGTTSILSSRSTNYYNFII